MMDFFRKHMKTIFIVVIVVFIGGAFVGFGGYFFGSRSTSDAVAEIDNVKIPYRTYANLYNRVIDNLRQEKQEVTEAVMQQKKQEVLQDLVQQEVFYEQAKKYGITVSDTELASDIQHYPAFQKNGQFDQQAYFQVLYQVLHTTPRDFEDSRRKQIAIFKLRQLIATSVIVTDSEARFEYALAHKGSTANFEKDKAKFMESLRQEKVTTVFYDWFKTLNQTVKIKIHLQEIERGA